MISLMWLCRCDPPHIISLVDLPCPESKSFLVQEIDLSTACLILSEQNDWQCVWAPNSKLLLVWQAKQPKAFIADVKSGKLVMSLNLGHTIARAPNPQDQPAWSPDGSQISFSCLGEDEGKGDESDEDSESDDEGDSKNVERAIVTISLPRCQDLGYRQTQTWSVG